MVSKEDTIFDCYSYGSRTKEDYEKDLVRISHDLEDIYNNWDKNVKSENVKYPDNLKNSPLYK